MSQRLWIATRYMLYRWRKEIKEGRLSENKRMRKKQEKLRRAPEDSYALKSQIGGFVSWKSAAQLKKK